MEREGGRPHHPTLPQQCRHPARPSAPGREGPAPMAGWSFGCCPPAPLLLPPPQLAAPGRPARYRPPGCPALPRVPSARGLSREGTAAVSGWGARTAPGGKWASTGAQTRVPRVGESRCRAGPPRPFCPASALPARCVAKWAVGGQAVQGAYSTAWVCLTSLLTRIYLWEEAGQSNTEVCWTATQRTRSPALCGQSVVARSSWCVGERPSHRFGGDPVSMRRSSPAVGV